MNALFLAALLFVPGLPESATVDTESSTNVPFAFADGNIFHLQMDAVTTPSNSVMVAFGLDADGNGDLSPEESALLVGWSGETWMVRDVVGRTNFLASAETGDKTLDWRLRLKAANLAPRSLDARLNHVRIFEQWSERAPEFLFDRRWDLVRVSVCGMGERRFSLSAKRENDGLKVLVR